MKKAAVLFADGFEEVEAITPVDFLRRAGIQVFTAGVGTREVKGSHEIRVTTDMTVDELPRDLDAVIVPGGMPGAKNVALSKKAVSIIVEASNAGKLVAAICAAPAVVLAGAGLLAGKKFTCYPGYENEVSDGAFSAERVVRDGNLITSRGPGTAAEFAIEIIRYLEGDEAAAKIRRGTIQK
jgi:4-methyl-5(b-hydroxyethyl)-thiazole monophosphate biosynthesis